LPVAAIDWEATIGANLSQEFGEDEDEIVLKQGAPFHIVSVTNEDGAKNIKEADENCDEITKEDKELFLVGYCHALAIAIQELAGNSIVVILADDGEEIRPAHVINRYADDEFIDIRGVIDGGEAIQDIGLDGDDYEFVDISAAALERFYSKRHNGLLRPSAEIMARARAVAKILLPGDIKRGRR
jgi:hypothetical protein